MEFTRTFNKFYKQSKKIIEYKNKKYLNLKDIINLTNIMLELLETNKKIIKTGILDNINDVVSSVESPFNNFHKATIRLKLLSEVIDDIEKLKDDFLKFLETIVNDNKHKISLNEFLNEMVLEEEIFDIKNDIQIINDYIKNLKNIIKKAFDLDNINYVDKDKNHYYGFVKNNIIIEVIEFVSAYNILFYEPKFLNGSIDGFDLYYYNFGSGLSTINIENNYIDVVGCSYIELDYIGDKIKKLLNISYPEIQF
jgi:hypothetical protein